MSYAGIFGWTMLPQASSENKEALVNVLIDREVFRDVRAVALVLALWSDLISLGKAEELLDDIGITDSNTLIKAFEKLNEICC